MRNVLISFIVILVLFGLNACSGNIIMISKPDNETTIIDGQSNDWQGDLYKIDGTNLGIGVRNDTKYIYLCLISGDRIINRQIRMNGLFIWLDEKGKTNKHIGIKYPIGKSPADFRQIRKTHQQFEENQFPTLINPEFEFFTGKDYKEILPIHNNKSDIDLEINNGYNQLIYELKIPFAAILKNVTFDDLDNISIGIEIPNMDRNNMKGQRPNGMSGGRSGGRGAMGGGQRPGSMGGRSGMQQASNSIKKWIKVELK